MACNALFQALSQLLKLICFRVEKAMVVNDFEARTNRCRPLTWTIGANEQFSIKPMDNEVAMRFIFFYFFLCWLGTARNVAGPHRVARNDTFNSSDGWPTPEIVTCLYIDHYVIAIN